MKNTLFIVWNESNDTNIRIIDEQHRGIVSSINTLYYFVQNGRGIEVVKSVLIMIEQYIEIHFKVEESLMQLSNYPAMNDHINFHRELASKTERLFLEINKNKDPNEVLRFLKEWWINHINNEDKKYVPYIVKLIDD